MVDGDIMNTIDEFLEHYPNKHTSVQYRLHLNDFFKTMKVDPDKYLNNGRDYWKDIETYWKTFINRPPKTRILAMTVIKMFLEENGIEFKRSEWRKLSRRAKGSKSMTKDKVPSPEELKDILQHARIQAKSLFITLATSGMRVGEALALTPKNIDLDHNPAKIEIPAEATKTGTGRTTFITNEARDCIKEWLKVRERYLITAVKRSTKSDKNPNDNRVWPFHYQTAYEMWYRLIYDSKYNKKFESKMFRKQRYEHHIHGLRKFFRSRLPKAIGVDMTEFLMGHEGYLTREYRNYSDEELGKEYLKGMDRLLIFETPADTSDIRESLTQKDKQMAAMQEQMKQMKDQIDEMRLERLEQLNGIKKKK